jgi:hypothetical protein
VKHGLFLPPFGSLGEPAALVELAVSCALLAPVTRSST